MGATIEQRKMQGRVYLLVADEIQKGDIVDYFDGGIRTRRVVSVRRKDVTVGEISFGSSVVEGKQRVSKDNILRCWRRRSVMGKEERA
jgi:hypothetical protein